MQSVSLGRSGLRTTRLIYGCMRMHGPVGPGGIGDEHRRTAFAALEAALEAGYTHFDHADIYGGGACERTFGAFLQANPGLRERVLITTKCGIRWEDEPPGAPHRYDFSAGHIRSSCERSLQRLGVETIDVYLLHRPDVLMDPDEIAGAFDELRQSGKVRSVGVSNFTPSQLALLQSRLPEPLACNQLEIHPLRLSPFEDGTLDDLHQRGIVPTSWSPVAGGRLFADPGTDGHLRALQGVLDAEAEALGVSRAVVLYAWLLAHPSGILPIVGSASPGRIREAMTAKDVSLSREAWYRIYRAARGEPLP